MAKRGAEALACPARLQSYLCRAPRPKRSRRDLEWREARGAAQRSAGGRPEKRKRGPMEEEGGGGGGGDGEEGAPGKRPAGPAASGAPTKEVAGELSPQRPATPEREPSPWPGIDGEAAAASGEPSAGRLAPTRPQQEEEEENEDDAWQYNSFQYWRCPLPAIDLCAILDLERDDTFETGDSSNVALSEMET